MTSRVWMFTAGVVLQVALAPCLRSQRPQSLEELQVTATRTTLPTVVVPAAVTVIDGDELRRRGIGFLLDALDGGPALSIIQTGSYGAVTSLFLRGGESDYTKLLIDGVPMNQPGGVLNLANLRLDDVDRIEIVAGPVSVLHGADAISGVIQVFTRRPDAGSRVELTASGGSLGNRELSGRVAARLGALGLSLAGSRFSSAGIYPFNSDYRNNTGSAHLNWQRGSTRIALTGRVGDVDAHFPTNSSGEVVDRNQHTLDRTTTLGANGRTSLGSVDLIAEGWFHRLHTDFRDPQDAADDTTGFAFRADREGVQERSGGQAGFDYRPTQELTLTVRGGIEHETETQHSSTISDFGFGVEETIGDFDARRLNRQAHLQMLAAPVEEVLIQAGARHDRSDAFGGATTWRLGASVEPVDNWRGWIAMGTAFKAPIFSELFANTAFEVGNPDLDPEHSTAVEAGLDWSGRRASVRVTGYHQRFRDLIQYVGAEPGSPTYLNLGAATAQGIDARVTVYPANGVRLRGHLSLLRTTVTDSGAASSAVFSQGQSLLRRPERSGGVTLMLEPAGTSLTLGYTWVGQRVDADFRDFPASRITLPSYGVLSGSWWLPIRRAGPGRTGFDLIFRGENLLDTEWQEAVGFPGRGRTFAVGGRVTY